MNVRERILVALAGGRRLSKWHIAREIGSHPNYVKKVLRQLRRDGLVLVSGWEHLRYESGDWTQVWAFGEGPDAPKPPRKTGAERGLDYRRRLKRDRPEERERQLAAKRQRALERRGSVRLDPILAALHGRG